MSANTQPPPPVKFFEFWKTLDEKMAEKLGRVSKTNFYNLPRRSLIVIFRTYNPSTRSAIVLSSLSCQTPFLKVVTIWRLTSFKHTGYHSWKWSLAKYSGVNYSFPGPVHPVRVGDHGFAYYMVFKTNFNSNKKLRFSSHGLIQLFSLVLLTVF